MPLVRKRKLEEETRKGTVKRPRRCKEFTEFENIGYRTDHWHSVFRSIPENIEDVKRVLARYVGSLINGDGGILCFGVRKTGVIYGENINRKEEDNIRLVIDEIFKKMHPHVPTDGYRVTFTPVLGSAYRRYDGVKEVTKQQVLEVRVAPGDPFSLYEDQNHEVYLRKGDAPYGPLTPHEIKRHTVQQLRHQLKSQKDVAKLFDTPKQKRTLEISKEYAITNRKTSSSSLPSPLETSLRPPNRQSTRLAALNKENTVTKKPTSNSSSPVKSSKSSKPRPPSRQASRSPSNNEKAVTKDKRLSSGSAKKKLAKNNSEKLSTSRPTSRQRSRSPPSNKETAGKKRKSLSAKKSAPNNSKPPSRQTTPSPSKARLSKPAPPPKAAGSCKDCPVVLSSGESDLEVPLPSVPPQTKSEQNLAAPVKNEVVPKMTVRPFHMKRPTPLMSITNVLEVGKQLDKVIQVQPTEVASSLQQQQRGQQTMETKKLTTIQGMMTRSIAKKNSLTSSQPQSSKPPPKKPTANNTAVTAVVQPQYCKPPPKKPTANNTAVTAVVQPQSCKPPPKKPTANNTAVTAVVQPQSSKPPPKKPTANNTAVTAVVKPQSSKPPPKKPTAINTAVTAVVQPQSSKPPPKKPTAINTAVTAVVQPQSSKPPPKKPTVCNTAARSAVKTSMAPNTLGPPPPPPPRPPPSLYSYPPPPPRPTPSLYSYPPPPHQSYHPYRQPPQNHYYHPAPEYHTRQHHAVKHSYDYPNHYPPQYGGYSTQARGSSAPLYKPHPLSTSYLAPYNDFAQ